MYLYTERRFFVFVRSWHNWTSDVNARTALWTSRSIPANTKPWTNVVFMLVQRLRRWPIIITTVDHCLMFVAIYPANTRRWHNVGSIMLKEAPGRWPNNKPTLGQCLTFGGIYTANTRCWDNVGSIMLRVAPGRWPNNKPTLGQCLTFGGIYTANTRCWHNVGSIMLRDQRLRRWLNVKSTLGRVSCLVGSLNFSSSLGQSHASAKRRSLAVWGATISYSVYVVILGVCLRFKPHWMFQIYKYVIKGREELTSCSSLLHSHMYDWAATV